MTGQTVTFHYCVGYGDIRPITARIVEVYDHPHYGPVAVLNRKAFPRRVVLSRLNGRAAQERERHAEQRKRINPQTGNELAKPRLAARPMRFAAKNDQY